jgi:hypothetical protein
LKDLVNSGNSLAICHTLVWLIVFVDKKQSSFLLINEIAQEELGILLSKEERNNMHQFSAKEALGLGGAECPPTYPTDLGRW